ncbi:dual specificity phosphatase 29-like isoform X4 [Oratosquilla oratoria]|uniref:dual specificity phosphatase 29-like isoform X4 n=1 Tax=Oratosquilla oratoria TaxID=337810 RepID=UPI003F7573FB
MGMSNLPRHIQFPSYVEDLKEVLLTVEPRLRPIPDMRLHVSRFVDGADMDEVYPQLYVGDCDAAMNKQYLLRHGITHIVNAAGNLKGGPAAVRTGPDFYKVLQSKVLVHCRQGRSRSASIAIAFLMLHRGMTAARSLRILRESRAVRPNNGFLQQLADLDLQLFRERLEKYRREHSDSDTDSDSDSDSDSEC